MTARKLAPLPERWYMVSADGLATLCLDEQNARDEAAKADTYYPRRAPHRAVLLGDVAAERERWRAWCAKKTEDKRRCYSATNHAPYLYEACALEWASRELTRPNVEVKVDRNGTR